MRNWILILILLVTVAVVGKKCNKGNEPILTVYSDVQQNTPQGVLVASKNGVSAEQLDAIDDEFLKLFRDVAARNYQILHFNNVIYVLHDCVLSPVTQSPSFLIRADQYDGSVFDIDPRPGIGKIYAAEYVITDNRGNLTNQYVICSADGATTYFRNSVRFGKEHLLLAENDREEYRRTQYHGDGGVNHPIVEPTGLTNPLDRTPARTDVTDYGGRIKIAK